MSRIQLERHQLWFYLAAIAVGLSVGAILPVAAPYFKAAVLPALGLLLFATFMQVTLTRLPEAFRDRRLLAATLIGNFAVVPVVVWLLVQLLPDDPAIRLGVLLVLLVPCTDWFIAFAHLGRGDLRRAVAITPVNLVMQVLTLPIFVWLMMGDTAAEALVRWQTVLAAVLLIGLPLMLAGMIQYWITARKDRSVWQERLVVMPVPLVGLVVFLVAASQVQTLATEFHSIGTVILAYLGYLAAAPFIAIGLVRIFRLHVSAGRTLAFSLGTRNSFVVLPIALALPPGWEAAVVVIVFQSLVELVGMAAYVRWIPRWLLPD